MPPIVYMPSRKRLVLALFGALAFVFIGAGGVIARPTVLTVVVAATAVPFFGWGSVLFVIRLVRRRPELTVTDEGFDHRQLGRIAWHEVESVVPAEYSPTGRITHRFVEVRLHDPQAYLARRPPAARMLARSNMAMLFSPVTISAITLSRPFAEVLLEMQQRHKQFQAAAEAPPTSA